MYTINTIVNMQLRDLASKTNAEGNIGLIYEAIKWAPPPCMHRICFGPGSFSYDIPHVLHISRRRDSLCPYIAKFYPTYMPTSKEAANTRNLETKLHSLFNNRISCLSMGWVPKLLCCCILKIHHICDFSYSCLERTTTSDGRVNSSGQIPVRSGLNFKRHGINAETPS